MARLARLALAGRAHYVAQATVHGQALAEDDQDRQALLSALQAAAAAHKVAVWGYALLPDGLQLVACPTSDEGLGRMMQQLGRRYVAAFNRRHGRAGALWAGRYRAAVVEPGDWLLSALCRVDELALAQPATAEGPWSSAPHHLGLARQVWLADPPEIWALGNTPFERENAYRARLHGGVEPARAAALARAVHGAWVAGSEAFAAEVAEAAGRPASPRRPGRPRRQAIALESESVPK